MKKTSDQDKTVSGARKKHRPCLMAYTINNTQPVICTIVADQPYFYMEEESQYAEEDDILGLEEYADFEKDLGELKRKMAAFERLSKSYERAPERRLSDFAEQAKDMTASREHASLMQPVDAIKALLNESRMATALLDFASDHNVHMIESDQTFGARYDRDAGKIFIHPDLSYPECVLLAVRELRRHWQHRKGAMIHPLTFHPDQAILINRAQEADLSIAMVRVGWELQLAGQKDVWDHIENSGMADLGRAFAREAFTDFRSLASGKASSAVFETWFLSERCRHQDKKLIQGMLADHLGYVFTNEEASRSVSIELICALGQQPFGNNYLAPYAQMVIEDPVFTEVRDRSNANFLWFIKFERSFRETEQALQSDEGINDRDILSSSPHTKAGLPEHAEPIVISLDAERELINRSHVGLHRSNLEDESAAANVIHVRFGKTSS